MVEIFLFFGILLILFTLAVQVGMILGYSPFSWGSVCVMSVSLLLFFPLPGRFVSEMGGRWFHPSAGGSLLDPDETFFPLFVAGFMVWGFFQLIKNETLRKSPDRIGNLWVPLLLIFGFSRMNIQIIGFEQGLFGLPMGLVLGTLFFVMAAVSYGITKGGFRPGGRHPSIRRISALAFVLGFLLLGGIFFSSHFEELLRVYNLGIRQKPISQQLPHFGPILLLFTVLFGWGFVRNHTLSPERRSP